MSSENYKIVSMGEVLWDLFPDGACFGGAPANFACHAALLGGHVSMLSAVGDDPRGHEAIAILQGFGLDTSLIQKIADAPTGSVSVAVDAAGKPSFTIHSGSAWDRIAWTDALESRIADIDAIYFGTLGQRGARSKETIHRALHLAKEHGVVRVLDVNLRKPYYDAALIRESVGEADVLKLSDDELPEVAAACGIALDTTPEVMLRGMLSRFHLNLIAMTRGAAGALLVSTEEVIDQPGIPTRVVDTVGAGDAFTAALVLGLLQRNSHKDILQKACEIASKACSHSGAVPSPSNY